MQKLTNITDEVKILSNGECQIGLTKYLGVGFGTFPFKGDTCFTALEYAYEAGFRIIDTATYYENFAPINKILKKHGRDPFYIISKVWPFSHTRALLQKDLDQTLKKLNIQHLDAYFLHWPNSKVPIEETMETLEEFRTKKLIRHIGLSNVTVNHLKRALECNVPITWVQVEMNPFFYDPELLLFCKDHQIVVQSWGPLGRGRINDHSLLTKMAKKYEKTAAQIALRWIIQHRCLPLPGSTNPQHIKENIDIMNFVLSEEEMIEINAIAKKGTRERVTIEMGAGFEDEFDFSYENCWPKQPR